MNTYIKNAISWAKKTFLIMFVALAVIGIEIFIPHASSADFLIDNTYFLDNTFTSQDNTLLGNQNPTPSAKVQKRVKMVVTAYSSTPDQTDSTPFITASGKTVTDGIVANNLLPFGTKIRLPELYGDKVFVVEDRMNSRKGDYHLDIWFSSTNEAKGFGSEMAYIEVLAD